MSNPSRLSIAVVGCGAVTQSFHLPVLAGHDRVRIAALVDPDLSRAQKLGALYGVDKVFASIDALDRSVADASYWLYLIHLPIVVAIQGALKSTGFNVEALSPLISIPLCAIPSLALAWQFHLHVERRFMGVSSTPSSLAPFAMATTV